MSINEIPHSQHERVYLLYRVINDILHHISAMINSCSLTWVDTVRCHVCLRLQLCQVGRVAMMQCLYDCQRACFWPRARAPSQPFSPPFPLHPPPRCPRPYAWSYCFHCHTISSTTDLFSPALMRRNYLQASNKPRPILHVHTCSRARCQSPVGVIQQKQSASVGTDGGNGEGGE